MKKTRYIGSEGIQDPAQKLERIKELSGIKKDSITESKGSLETLLHKVDAADGNTYGLAQEGGKVFLKKLVGENFEYMSGLENKTEFKYDSLAEGLKQLNIMLKDINVLTGNVHGTELLKKK